MQLEQVAHYNDLSEQLRKELRDKVIGFGKTVRYKFDISNQNPDPTKHNGPIIWPTLYTLDPAVFNITDPYEKRERVSRSKKIALVTEVDEKGLPKKFRKIRVFGRNRGVLTLTIEENNDDFYTAMFLELHPKLADGKFSDKSKKQVITRIDERKHAKEQREIRSARTKAGNVAQTMSEEKMFQFADAMQWESGLDPEVLRNMVEELADTDPVFFNDLVEGEQVEYRSVVKRGLDNNIIAFDPADWKIVWSSNLQPITVLSPGGDKSHIEKLAEWFLIGGDKAKSSYEKLKELIK